MWQLIHALHASNKNTQPPTSPTVKTKASEITYSHIYQHLNKIRARKHNWNLKIELTKALGATDPDKTPALKGSFLPTRRLKDSSRALALYACGRRQSGLCSKAGKHIENDPEGRQGAKVSMEAARGRSLAFMSCH